MLRILRSIYYSVRSFYFNIKNLVVWFPIIWRQREYDYFYIIYLLEKKFELIEKHMKSKYCCASVNQDAKIKQIMICKNLCKRITEGNYLHNALTRHHEIYGDHPKWTFEPIEGSKFGTMNFNMSYEEEKSFRRAGKHSRMMEKQDYDLLFKIMQKYITKWWD